jgi:hypothetical protein
MFPAVLVLLNVPISIDKCNDDTVFPLDVCLYVLLKLIGLINALQFRRASNSKTKWVKETAGSYFEDNESRWRFELYVSNEL